MGITVSKHAEARMKQRCGVNKRSAQKIAEKAFKTGFTHSQTKGNLKKWVTSLYFSHKTANNIRPYGDKAYIFAGETLITVLQVPSNLRNDMKSLVSEE